MCSPTTEVSLWGNQSTLSPQDLWQQSNLQEAQAAQQEALQLEANFDTQGILTSL